MLDKLSRNNNKSIGMAVPMLFLLPYLFNHLNIKLAIRLATMAKIKSSRNNNITS